jgi:signal peptidase I
MDRADSGPTLSALPAGRAAGALAPAAPRSRWRRALLLVGVALLPAVVLRGCVLDTFAIRSASMAPLFAGTAEGGDHLLVLRAGLDPRAPERWDVVVADGAVDPELPEGFGALLKRVVALAGERLALRDGDVWIAPDGRAPLVLARKPDDLIPGLLVRMHAGAGLAAPWTWEGPGEREDLPRGGVRLAAGEEPGLARFAETITDGLPGEPGDNAVSDTALRLELGACDGVLELHLREGAEVYRARLAPAALGGAALQHNLGGRVVAEAPGFPGLRAGDEVLAWNVDGGVRVLVNGVTLLSWDQPPHAEGSAAGAPRNDPALLVSAGSVELRRVEVLRDLHYTAEGGRLQQGEAGVGPGQLFLLGDHSSRSRDSRFFGPVFAHDLLGRPFARYVPRDRAGWLDRRGLP